MPNDHKPTAEKAESGTLSPVLDWRELAPAPEIHSCDCGYCEMGGELEPVQWPTLVPISGDPEYVTDRYLAIRADLAPVPDGYGGPVLGGGPKVPHHWNAPVTNKPPNGTHFRWQTLRALELTGWRLRLMERETKAWNKRVSLVAVVTTEGEHIGWAVAAREPADDFWGGNVTREYQEASDAE